MFTGIIQAVGHVTHCSESGGGDARITIAADGLDMCDVQLGDSIACNGVCLTVVAFTSESFSVDVSAETFACTIGFAPGDRVDLEKAMRLSDRLGGHLVSGHVDGVGEVIYFAAVADGDGSWRLDIRAPEQMRRYLAAKGSVAVNGVSLTVNRVGTTPGSNLRSAPPPEGAKSILGRPGDRLEEGAEFSINLIPHTLEHTMFKNLQPGSRVNLEADMLARYAERLLAYTQDTDKE